MFKATIPNGTTLTNGNPIPLSVVLNTNRKTIYDEVNREVIIREPGYYDVTVSLTLTDATASPLALQIVSNGDVLKEITQDITVTTGTETIVLIDMIRVVSTYNNEYVPLSFVIDGGAADCFNDGLVLIENRR